MGIKCKFWSNFENNITDLFRSSNSRTPKERHRVQTLSAVDRRADKICVRHFRKRFFPSQISAERGHRPRKT